jgi:hypothetical protein
MKEKEHLKVNGLLNIINLNRGLSNNLKTHFLLIATKMEPKPNLPIYIDNNWIAGFFSGEGCFALCIIKSKILKLGYTVTLRVIIGQHTRDKLLIKHFVSIFKCGHIIERKNKKYIEYVITKFEDIYHKIIPFFKKHKIEGIKSRDFQDFCKGAELIAKKAHLTEEGLNKLF